MGIRFVQHGGAGPYRLFCWRSAPVARCALAPVACFPGDTAWRSQLSCLDIAGALAGD
jgi:hypothetical protein